MNRQPRSRSSKSPDPAKETKKRLLRRQSSKSPYPDRRAGKKDSQKKEKRREDLSQKKDSQKKEKRREDLSQKKDSQKKETQKMIAVAQKKETQKIVAVSQKKETQKMVAISQKKETQKMVAISQKKETQKMAAISQKKETQKMIVQKKETQKMVAQKKDTQKMVAVTHKKVAYKRDAHKKNSQKKDSQKRDSGKHDEGESSKKNVIVSSTVETDQQPGHSQQFNQEIEEQQPPLQTRQPNHYSMLGSKIIYNGGQPCGELSHIYVKLYELTAQDDIKVQLLDCEKETYQNLSHELVDGGVRVFYKIKRPGLYEIIININHRSRISIFDVPSDYHFFYY